MGRSRSTWAAGAATAAGVPTRVAAIEFELDPGYDVHGDGALDLLGAGLGLSIATVTTAAFVRWHLRRMPR